MSISAFAIIVLLFVLGGLSLYHRVGVRTTARAALGFFLALSISIALALIYASVRLSDRGAGVLVLLAMPVGIVAWILGKVYFASVKSEEYFGLTGNEKIASNLALHDAMVVKLEQDILSNTAKRSRFLISSRQRARLDQQISDAQETLANLAVLREALQKPETYRDDQT